MPLVLHRDRLGGTRHLRTNDLLAQVVARPVVENVQAVFLDIEHFVADAHADAVAVAGVQVDCYFHWAATSFVSAICWPLVISAPWGRCCLPARSRAALAAGEYSRYSMAIWVSPSWLGWWLGRR